MLPLYPYLLNSNTATHDRQKQISDMTSETKVLICNTRTTNRITHTPKTQLFHQVYTTSLSVQIQNPNHENNTNTLSSLFNSKQIGISLTNGAHFRQEQTTMERTHPDNPSTL